MRKITWSQASRNDLVRIDTWLERERSPEYALRTLLSIRARIRFIESFPHGGAPVSEALRKLRVPNTGFIILYRLEREGTEIVRVFHEREDWQNEL